MPETIHGTVHRVYFASPTFSAGVLDAGDGVRIKFSGKFHIAEGEPITVVGDWQKHPKFGYQFTATGLTYDLPETAEGLVRYLAKSVSFRGIGEATAAKIVEYAGTAAQLDRLIREGLDELRSALRIPLSTLQTLREQWITHAAENKVRTYLSALELSPHQIDTLLEQFGEGIVSVLKADPYMLIRHVRGYGFKRVDEIARKTGISKDHPGRIKAGLLHTVQEEIDNGHTWVDGGELVRKANDLLLLDGLDSVDRIKAAGKELIDSGDLILEKQAVSLPYIYEAEKTVADTFAMARMLPGMEPMPGVQIPEDLNPGQRAAFIAAMKGRVSAISGAAGSGKTFVVGKLAQAWSNAGKNICLCAPTGKAAKRIEEVLRDKHGIADTEARTLHRVLGYDGRSFHTDRIDADVIVVDECFDYKQPILTEIGWQPIGAIVKHQEAVRVYAHNPETGKLELRPIIRWIKHDAPSRLLKISAGRSDSTRNARVIRCTPEHKILTPYGYRMAGDLQVGEEVVARGHCLTKEQRSIVIGSLLGDGSISRSRKRRSPQIVLMQGDDQRDYLEFKRQAFGVLSGKLQKGKSGYGGKMIWRTSLNMTDDQYDIAPEMVVVGRHPSGRQQWSPTDRFIQWIDAQALAIWYLDNGSLISRTNVDGSISHFSSLHSQRFNREAHTRLSAHLRKTFGLNVTVANDSHGNLFMRFSKEATTRLFEVIRPYVPSAMSYKIGGDGCYSYTPNQQPEICAARIRAIDECKPTSSHVYDIEVAEHHNYVAGNIIVSNCSMVDVPLCAELFRRVDLSKSQVVLVGDHNQLPPVGPGNILRDIMHYDLVPNTVLDTVVRNAGPIERAAQQILSGAVPPTVNNEPQWAVVDSFKEPQAIQAYLRDLVLDMIPRHLGYDPVSDVQIITPVHKGALGTQSINKMMQYLIQGDVHGRFAIGDKVIQTVNDYNLGIMNGHQGRVLDIDKDGITVGFDGEEPKVIEQHKQENLNLAYALTAHKAQGSEFPCVVVLCHKSHYFADRNWLYTAVTRAAKHVIVLGDRWGLNNAGKKNEVKTRRTLLSLWSTSNSPSGIAGAQQYV